MEFSISNPNTELSSSNNNSAGSISVVLEVVL